MSEFKRDDNLGLPGDDLRVEYRIALLVPCPNLECRAPVGYLCAPSEGAQGFFCYSRYKSAIRMILEKIPPGTLLDAYNKKGAKDD